jgi:hypothetical protein
MECRAPPTIDPKESPQSSLPYRSARLGRTSKFSAVDVSNPTQDDDRHRPIDLAAGVSLPSARGNTPSAVTADGATYSWIDTFIIVAQVPVACLGGILALLVTGIPFSVSAAVGFISIFGIAAMDGILLTTYIRQLWDQRHPFVESIIMGSDRRLRATMMTDLVDALGFLPAALSTRIGAQAQRPLAVVVIGGALAIALLTRVLQPALIYLCHSRPRSAETQSS